MKRTTLTVPTAPERTAVVVPGEAPGATRSWRRMVTGVDPSYGSAYGLSGPWLAAGVAHGFPPGAVVIAVDRVNREWTVRMMRVTDVELVDEKVWTLKTPLGKRVLDYMARRLAPDAAEHRAVRLEPESNPWEGQCRNCRNTVPAQEGHYRRGHGVTHKLGECPPPPPPPDQVRPNRRGEPCLLCGGWVEAYSARALLLSHPIVDDEGTILQRYQATHDTCPPDPVPGPANRRPGWCRTCRRVTHPGEGYWHEDALRHKKCPQAAGGDTWIVRLAREARVGETVECRVDLRGGYGQSWQGLDYRVWRRPDNPPVPLSTPGFRYYSPTYVGIIGVVIDTIGRQALVRAASRGEAHQLLAARAAHVVVPAPGQPARWGVEVIQARSRHMIARMGRMRTWCAELTGRDPDYGFSRKFLRADFDYSEANSTGSRGVMAWWTLHASRVYEARYWEAWKRQVTVFLRVEDGLVVEMTRQEAEAWLAQAATWIAS